MMTWRKCATCGRMNKLCECNKAALPHVRSEPLLALLEDDLIAEAIASDCHDPGHDPRSCPTCEARTDGIDAYRTEIIRRNANKVI